MKNIKLKLCVCFVASFIFLIIIHDAFLSPAKSDIIDASDITNLPLAKNDELDFTSNESSSSSGEFNSDDFNSGDFTPILPVENASLVCTHQIQTSNNSTYSGNYNLNDSEYYAQVEGITTFRGNNFRDSAFYGSVDVSEEKLTKVWTNVIGHTDNWTGIGWNGQPAIIKWDELTKKHMNIYDEFKEKDNFTEIIYGALDSTIYFYDLKSGYPSRDPIKVASSIKGSVTVDPRGYPLLYVGQGIDTVSGEKVSIGYHIFSLITGEELFFINGRDAFAYIGWGAFDGNPLIDSATDTMFLPGENGLIYIIKLNTIYDKEAGTISLNPSVVKYRTTINGRAGGIENSIAIYKNLAYFANNNGIIQCLDLNTLTPIWNFQMEDDCDATIGIEIEDGVPMIYEACEVDRRKETAPAVARKINGLNGQPIWEYSCDCLYDSSVNGGVLSSVVIGKGEISDLVIFNFSKTTSFYNGKMVALNKETGDIVWEKDLNKYSWSSPVAIYSTSGKPYLIFCDSVGQVFLLNPRTGETLYKLNTGGGNIEGSPAIFNDKIVIGTRGKRIFCIKIS